MFVTLKKQGRTITVEGADTLTPAERLELVAALMPPPSKTRGASQTNRIIACAWCGREVIGRSSKRMYCSIRCKVAAHRAKTGAPPPFEDEEERRPFEEMRSGG